MTDAVAFQTKARTVDHLGREQIADCPTAISELWKNAFDAYATRVELNIFDADEPVAVVSDNGHGMNRAEFENRWLVVGTESKASNEKTPLEDRKGLKLRPRQGQKGIGRLSCANLGPILLLVSKRANQPFVAALIDWRLFENPFLNLSDIFIPIIEFSDGNELFGQLPSLMATLLENVTGSSHDSRSERIKAAWLAYDRLYEAEQKEGGSNKLQPPSQEIKESVSKAEYAPSQLAQWPVWSGKALSGTALLVSPINYDLRILLGADNSDASATATKERFFETLSSFVDPFVATADDETATNDLKFAYVVQTWADGAPRQIVGSEKQFDRRLVEGMEHCIDGQISPDGIFTGRIKAFGKWLPDMATIDPPKDLIIPKRADTSVGPVDLFIAAMEFESVNSTHDKQEFQRYKELASKYSGFLMFRDGLRVLPFGRTDNDFFEIDSRRSKNAGREFWNHRQMFGRLAISRFGNPNLRDKAGREGLLDNRAAKTLRELVSYILMQTARRYFGSSSSIRSELLPQIKDTNKKVRADEARNKLRQKERREFRAKLQTSGKGLPLFLQELESYASELNIVRESEIGSAQQSLEQFKERANEFRLPGAPKNLGTLEDAYADYRDLLRSVNVAVSGLGEELGRQIERVNPTKPKELLQKQLARNAAQIHARIQGWKRSIDVLQKAEFERIRVLVSERNKVFHAEAQPLLHRMETGELSYSEVSKMMDSLKERIDTDNSELFQPYIGALESLKESIDLTHLASFGMEELSELREEMERLNSLAQLGIAVEIVGHELQSYDDIIGSGLQDLPAQVRESKAAKNIAFGYEGLTDQLRFLSPLRLAGQKIQRWISGREISEYMLEFFKLNVSKNGINLHFSDAFKKTRIFDQQSRLFPVFINLLNNSIYWLSSADQSERKILVGLLGEEVIISDNGPGVDASDIESLFTLFFTKKARGGRGVGLYLSRANLSAGGHRIRYEANPAGMPLSGANFLIDFRGAEFDGS